MRARQQAARVAEHEKGEFVFQVLQRQWLAVQGQQPLLRIEPVGAEDQLLASVRQLVDVQSRALTLDIGLHRALGGGWSETETKTPGQA